MKGITGNPVLDAYQRAIKPVSPAERPEGARAPSARSQTHQAAKVSISSEARALAAGGQSPINTHKVEALKAAIHDGSFRVDSQRVADAIVNGSG